MNTSQHIPEDRLAAYFDGEVAETEALPIEQHVATCTACRQVLDDMALTRNALCAAQAPALSQAVWQRVETALEPQRVTPVLLLHRLPRIAVAAAIMLCLTTFAVLALVVAFDVAVLSYRPRMAAVAASVPLVGIAFAIPPLAVISGELLAALRGAGEGRNKESSRTPPF